MAASIDDGELIECIHQFPCIYDKHHVDYRNKAAKLAAWAEVGRRLSVNEVVCEQRWAVLRNRFATELRIKKKNPTASFGVWRYSDSMAFLEEHISPRKTRMVLNKNSKVVTGAALKSERDNESATYADKSPRSADKSPRSADGSPHPPMIAELISTNNTSPARPRLLDCPPVVPIDTRLVNVQHDNDLSVPGSSTSCGGRHSECKSRHELDDEDILFGKSIGLTLKNIKNKKIKLQVKSEILSIMAEHADS